MNRLILLRHGKAERGFRERRRFRPAARAARRARGRDDGRHRWPTWASSRDVALVSPAARGAEHLGGRASRRFPRRRRRASRTTSTTPTPRPSAAAAEQAGEAAAR